jgi:hypothetical protein
MDEKSFITLAPELTEVLKTKWLAGPFSKDKNK